MALRCGVVVLLLVVALPFVAAQEEGLLSTLDSRISFDVSDAEVRGVLKTLAEAFDLNMVVGEGIEVARVLLGHADISTTEIYAERDAEIARRVAAKIG